MVRLFEGFECRHNRWQVWSDFITMSAISISNTIDRVHAEERENTYTTLQSRYSDAEMRCFAEMLALYVDALEEDSDQDFLGELYMGLSLSNEHKGQFFTPYDVCRMMARISMPDIRDRVAADGFVSVNDPACGAGALLVAFANECLRQEVNYQTSVLFIAQDIDYVVGLMCYLQLSLIGAPGYVVIGDTLLNPSTAYDRKGLIPRDDGNVWYTPMYCSDTWHWRRVWARMDMMFASNAPVQTQAPESALLSGTAEPEGTPKAPETAAPPSYTETASGQLTIF